MAVTFTTPLMSMILPTVGVAGQVGPTWASNLNSAFQVIDSHNHAPGSGAQVTSAGLNINADLGYNGNNATGLNSARFNSQVSALVGAYDKNALYVVNGNFYFNNASGVAVQITSGAGINAASIGGIGGDYATSTASEFYTSATKTFTFTQNSGITASIASGPISIFQNITSAQGITIQSPASLGAAYSMTLPTALPGSTLPVLMDSSGNLSTGQIQTAQIGAGQVQSANIGAQQVVSSNIGNGAVGSTQIASGAVGPAQKASLNYAASGSSGSFSTASTSDVGVVSCTITTSGRPVWVSIVADGSTNLSGLSATSGSAVFSIYRDSTLVATTWLTNSAGTSIIPGAGLSQIDGVSAGTHTYALNARRFDSNAGVANLRIIAYEL